MFNKTLYSIQQEGMADPTSAPKPLTNLAQTVKGFPTRYCLQVCKQAAIAAFLIVQPATLPPAPFTLQGLESYNVTPFGAGQPKFHAMKRSPLKNEYSTLHRKSCLISCTGNSM